MRTMHISNTKSGMELGETIFNDKGTVLLKAGMILTDSLIKRLEIENVGYVKINDHSNVEIPIQECLTHAQRKIIIDSIKSVKIEGYSHIECKDLSDAATMIIENVAKSKNISFDLLDIRTDKNYDYSHAVATAELSVAIAQECIIYNKENQSKFNNNVLRVIASAALLMDIGKSCQNEKVRKQLNISKYEEKDVPIYGHKLTHDAFFIANPAVISTGILFSKTNENKTNCPKGFEHVIEKQKINPVSKILHVADYYNNLIVKKQDNGRIYGPAEAMETILALSNTIFDKKVVETFLHHVAIFPIGMDVLLSNKEHAIVVGNNLGEDGYNYRPIVQTIDGNVYNLMDAENSNLTIIPNSKDNDFDFNYDATEKFGLAR